jgi:phage-related protein
MKTLGWIGGAKDDLLGLPADVVREVGHALYAAQMGGKHAAAKPLRGFGGASTLEIVANHEGNTFRVVYTVRFPRII